MRTWKGHLKSEQRESYWDRKVDLHTFKSDKSTLFLLVTTFGKSESRLEELVVIPRFGKKTIHTSADNLYRIFCFSYKMSIWPTCNWGQMTCEMNAWKRYWTRRIESWRNVTSANVCCTGSAFHVIMINRWIMDWTGWVPNKLWEILYKQMI